MANRLTMDIITKIISEKKLFWISFAIIGYFCLLYLNAYFAKSDLVFIGWIQELLTIPFILFQHAVYRNCCDQCRCQRYKIYRCQLLQCKAHCGSLPSKIRKHFSDPEASLLHSVRTEKHKANTNYQKCIDMLKKALELSLIHI